MGERGKGDGERALVGEGISHLLFFQCSFELDIFHNGKNPGRISNWDHMYCIITHAFLKLPDARSFKHHPMKGLGGRPVVKQFPISRSECISYWRTTI